MSGTAEVDGIDKTAFNMFPGRYVVSIDINGKDDAGPVQVELNVNASGTADNGNIAMQSYILSAQTYDFTATFV